MDWNHYRSICDTPNVLSRWMLERSAVLLEDDGEAGLARVLREAALARPLDKPEGHRGGADTDFFVVDLREHQVRKVLAIAGAAADRRAGAGFVAAWQEYADWLAGVHPRSPATTDGRTSMAADDDE